MGALLTIGRVLLGLCFALDGAWWLYTWDVRVAYLEQSGPFGFLVVPFAVAYLVCGLLVAIGRAVRPATLPLMAVAGLIATLVHTDLGPGGIGEYQLERHGVVNAGALLTQATLVGSLMLPFGAPKLHLPIDVRAIVFGRVLIGGTLVVGAIWQAHDYDARFALVEAAAGDPIWVPLLIAVRIALGVGLAMGRFLRLAAAGLALAIAAGLVVTGGALDAGADLGTAASAHQLFVGGATIGGLLQLTALGPIASRLPPSADVPATTDAGTENGVH